MYYCKTIFLLIFFFGCDNQPSELDLLNKKNPKGDYGQSILTGDAQNINELLKNPDNYLNRNVIVNGVIHEVCPMRGCWIQISDINGIDQIRVKVTDGEIVFPLSGKDHIVTVKGTFTRLDLSKEQAINWKVHLAEEKGITLNPDNIILQEGDYYEYRISCTGAVIL